MNTSNNSATNNLQGVQRPLDYSSLGGVNSAFHQVANNIAHPQQLNLNHHGGHGGQFYPQSQIISNNGVIYQGTPTSQQQQLSPGEPTNGFGQQQLNINNFGLKFEQESAGLAQSGTPNSSRPASRATSPGLCAICHDKATGKHYGAYSCDGCKGFFRRTVRKNQKYTCRFNEKCVIDKDKRNTCRYCRYKKCLDAGMKNDAVQNERDRLRPRKGDTGEQLVVPDIIEMLMKAEAHCSQLRQSVIQQPPQFSTGPSPEDQEHALDYAKKHMPTLPEITINMKHQLLLLVEWAKAMPEFTALSLDDQVILLRSYASENLTMVCARRSIKYKDIIQLSNNACILRAHLTFKPTRNCSTTADDRCLINANCVIRILEELVEPMKKIDMDDTEFVCLKGILFFNPYLNGIKEKTRINELRQSLIHSLDSHITFKNALDRTRMAQILLLSSSLQGVSQLLAESLNLAKLFGVEVDNLVEELMLADSESAAMMDKLATTKWLFDREMPLLTPTSALTEVNQINEDTAAELQMMEVEAMDTNVAYQQQLSHIQNQLFGIKQEQGFVERL